MRAWTACPDETELARQAAIWGADRLAARREGRAFIEAHGLANNYLTRIREVQNPPFSVLLAMARWFGMSLEEMLEQAWAQRDGSEEDRLGRPKTVPEICNAALHRFSQAPPKLGHLEIAKPLEYLDDVRYSDPMSALVGLQKTLPDLAPEQVPFVLQVAASCFRTVSEYKEASYCLGVAEEVARTTGNTLALGDNRQRWIYLYNSVGYRQLAFERCKDAHGLYTELGNQRKIAETVVDRAYCLYHMGEFERALSTYSSAVELHSDAMGSRHRIFAMQGKANTYLQLNRTEEAKNICDNLLEFTREHSSIAAGKTLWLLARIEQAQKDHSAAEEHLIEASTILKEVSPVEAALVSLELLHMQIDTGMKSNFFDQISGELASRLGQRLPEIATMLQDLTAALQLNRLSLVLILIDQTTKRIEDLRPAYLKASRLAPG